MKAFPTLPALTHGMLIALLAVCCLNANAQFTVTADDYRASHPIGTQSGGYTTGYMSPVGVDIGTASSSSAQNWNFSSLPFTHMSDFEFIDAATAPQHSLLGDANVIRKSTILSPQSVYYQYNQITDDAYFLLATWSEGDAEPSLYTPPVLQIAFPCSLGESWTWQSDPREIIQGTFIETFQSTTVDAYGTLRLPQGTFNALRMKTHVTTTTTMPQLSMVRRTIAYNFFCKEAVGAFLSVDSTQENNSLVQVTGVGYEIASNISATKSPESFRVSDLGNGYPNPFSQRTIIPFTLEKGMHVTVRVHTALGALVRTLVDGHRDAGRHFVEWMTDGLPGGLYFVTMQTPGGTRSIRMQHIR